MVCSQTLFQIYLPFNLDPAFPLWQSHGSIWETCLSGDRISRFFFPAAPFDSTWNSCVESRSLKELKPFKRRTRLNDNLMDFNLKSSLKCQMSASISKSHLASVTTKVWQTKPLAKAFGLTSGQTSGSPKTPTSGSDQTFGYSQRFG